MPAYFKLQIRVSRLLLYVPVFFIPQVDLKCITPSEGGYYYPDHLPVLGTLSFKPGTSQLKSGASDFFIHGIQSVCMSVCLSSLVMACHTSSIFLHFSARVILTVLHQLNRPFVVKLIVPWVHIIWLCFICFNWFCNYKLEKFSRFGKSLNKHLSVSRCCCRTKDTGGTPTRPVTAGVWWQRTSTTWRWCVQGHARRTWRVEWKYVWGELYGVL